MLCRAQALLAVAICGAALIAPALAQPSTASRTEVTATSVMPRSLPLKRDEATPQGTSSWISIALLLAVVAAGGALVVRRPGTLRWLAVRQGKAGSAGSGVARMSSQPLTTQASLHAVRWGGEELLLGCTAHSITVLARRPLLPPQEDVT